MTLLEMSGVYQDSAAALHGRIVELRGQERAQEDPEAAFRLRRRIDELTPLWRLSPPIIMTGVFIIMRNTPFDTRASEWIGDMTVWRRQNDPDNAERLDRLRRNLRRAREAELTPRQRQMLELYFDRGMNIPQIAEELGVNRSTVSRTLRRGKERLYRCLRYAL